MNVHKLRDIVLPSLDNDLSDLVYNCQINTMDAVNIQMLRIMRGNPNNVKDINPTTRVTGWSPDGVTWLPSAPGTFPPEEM